MLETNLAKKWSLLSLGFDDNLYENLAGKSEQSEQKLYPLVLKMKLPGARASPDAAKGYGKGTLR